MLAAGCLPATLSASAGGALELRGELYVPLKAFAEHNQRLEEAGERVLIHAMPGAGFMKRKDTAGLDTLGIQGFLYALAWSEDIALIRAAKVVC